MSMEMEVGSRESALQNGQQLELPLANLEIEAENQVRAALRQRHGVDPFDAEAMMSLMIPRP